MSQYKPHFACFNCHKTFKRRLLRDIQGGISDFDEKVAAKCPDCQELMANMGKDFKAPKKNDNKAWDHIETLYQVGITFHSCGCSGPGYVPRDSKELIEHLQGIKKGYLEHQHFWARRRQEPVTESEIAKDEHKNSHFLYSTPHEVRSGSSRNRRYDAKKAQIYWNKNVKEIEQKINSLTNRDN